MLKRLLTPFMVFAAMLATTNFSAAHDTWVETNTNVVRVGDAVHVSLMLGNHGNNHRDFKIAGKVDAGASTLEVLDPKGRRYDLKSQLIDTGYTPTEGFWTSSFVGTQPGLYTVVHTFDKVMSYAPERAVKSAKAFYIVSQDLNRVPLTNPGFNRVLDLPLELVPEINPVAPMGSGMPFSVRLYRKGKPLPNVVVSFIPRGETLTATFDARYEQKTNVNGRAYFSPTAANTYLVVAHWSEPKESGKGYDSTKYSATMTLFVPQICPCCGG